MLPELTLRFLRRADVRVELTALLAQPPDSGAAHYTIRGSAVLLTAPDPTAARRAARRLQDSLSAFAVEVPPRCRVPGRGSPRWKGLRCCAVRCGGGGRWVQGLTLKGMEEENRRHVRDALKGDGGERGATEGSHMEHDGGPGAADPSGGPIWGPHQ